MENMVICSRCNNPIDGTKKFCKYCGQPVQQEPNQDPNISPNQNQYQNVNQNQYQSESQSYTQPQSPHQGYGVPETQAQPPNYSQTQSYSGSQPYQQTYGNQAPANYVNQQYAGQYPAQQPMPPAWGANQVKKKSNKKVIGITISAVVVVAVIAVVLFLFVLPGGSPQKTAKQLEKAILTQDEKLARDCFDAATLQEFPESIFEELDMGIGSSGMEFFGVNMLDYLNFELNVLQVYNEGLQKNQCVVALEMSMSFDEKLIQELGKFVPTDDLGDYGLMDELAGFKEVEVLAMVKEGSKWKFSMPLTEDLSDYIYRIRSYY